MFKLSHLFHSSRNQLFQKRLLGEDVNDWFLFTSRACLSTATHTFAADGRLSDRVFTGYTIYKGKASLSAQPSLPTFSKLNSGALKIDRRGAIMLTFCPAIGDRKYDHEKRQRHASLSLGVIITLLLLNILVAKEDASSLEIIRRDYIPPFEITIFALSATEVGSFISLGPNDSCEFFHDPSMQTSNAGQVRKSLSVKAVADGSGYFISLNVANNLLKTNDRFTVPVTTAEFTVMREAFSFALPHILGWARSINQLPNSLEENPSKVLPQRMASEWDR